VSNEHLTLLQTEALARLQEQLKKQSPAAAVLQMQLAQARQLHRDAEATSRVASVPVGEQYLLFSLYDCDFAVRADTVQGVERLTSLTPVPNVAPWVKGVMNLRGSIISVVDLRTFLGLEPLPHNTRTRLLSLQCNEVVICFIVDAISEMLPIPPTTIVSGNARQAALPAWAAPYAAGVAQLGKRTIVLLDVARLLFSNKMQHYEV
jgi:purine-binding chemotaxis protein CheW